MTAVRPGSGRVDFATPALGPGLATLLAARDDGRPTLASVDGAGGCHQDRSPSTRRRSRRTSRAALWLRPADGIALVGVGRAGRPSPMDRSICRGRAGLAGLIGAARVVGASPVLIGGLGFTGR